MTDQAGLEVDSLFTGAGCLEGARSVCVPSGGGVSVSTDSSGAFPQNGWTTLEFAVRNGKTSAAQLLRELGATE